MAIDAKFRIKKSDGFLRRAEKCEERGDWKAAAKHLLAGAKAGEWGCKVNLAGYYAAGTGVKQDREKARSLYREVYEKGDSLGAFNLAWDYRWDNDFKNAVLWWKRAVKMGDISANLPLAKACLHTADDRDKAMMYLRRALKGRRGSEDISEYDWERAKYLLSRLENKKPIRVRWP
jgi:TPR repeat protein